MIFFQFFLRFSKYRLKKNDARTVELLVQSRVTWLFIEKLFFLEIC